MNLGAPAPGVRSQRLGFADAQGRDPGDRSLPLKADIDPGDPLHGIWQLILQNHLTTQALLNRHRISRRQIPGMWRRWQAHRRPTYAWPPVFSSALASSQ